MRRSIRKMRKWRLGPKLKERRREELGVGSRDATSTSVEPRDQLYNSMERYVVTHCDGVRYQGHSALERRCTSSKPSLIPHSRVVLLCWAAVTRAC
jgi:hypothetical protein